MLLDFDPFPVFLEGPSLVRQRLIQSILESVTTVDGAVVDHELLTRPRSLRDIIEAIEKDQHDSASFREAQDMDSPEHLVFADIFPLHEPDERRILRC